MKVNVEYADSPKYNKAWEEAGNPSWKSVELVIVPQSKEELELNTKVQWLTDY